ncbi:MAG: ribosomal RNA small subunit methyltransferase A [Deltaproteobacteria bacterium]|nr:MAG: ribosomal RNA small subunit methyltransferase A [Deltaproteobacteria bacterium]
MTAPRALLKAWNIQARKQLGQNFLNDANLARTIVNRAAITENETVLEIGPGLGAMTVPAAKAARRVFAVDKDGRIVELLKTELLAAGVDNVDIREADILRTNLDAIAHDAGSPLVVLGNLPYNISSQVVVRLIHARKGIDRAVLMLQKEMAQRICCGAGSRDYGRLSVMLGYCAQTQILMQVRADRFFPAPKVDSTVIGIVFLRRPETTADDEALLFKVIKAAFGKRRKTLRNALSQSALNLNAADCLQILNDVEIDPMRRAESLCVSEFVHLSNRIGQYYSGVPVRTKTRWS